MPLLQKQLYTKDPRLVKTDDAGFEQMSQHRHVAFSPPVGDVSVMFFSRYLHGIHIEGIAVSAHLAAEGDG